MKTFKKYKPTNEFLNMIEDPFKRGNSVWTKIVDISKVAAVTIEATISGVDKNHTAMISVITKSLDTFGEELASERLILHQKDFNSKEEATKHLVEKEKETSYK